MRRWLRSLRFALRALFGRDRKQAELDEEFQFHLEMRARDLEEQGMSRKEAFREARKLFGGLDKFKEESRDSWGTRVVVGVVRDVRHSFRLLWKSKVFSFAVVGTLALCIGANTTVFSVLYDLVLRPLPFENPDRIVRVYNVSKTNPNDPTAVGYGGSSWPQWHDFSDQADLFEGFAYSTTRGANRVFRERRLEGIRVNLDFFRIFAVKPELGRFFSSETDQIADSDVVVISESMWKQEFASNSEIIGKRMEFLNRSPATIIGVAPSSLEALDSQIDIFIPEYNPPRDKYIESRYFEGKIWGRLKPGANYEQAMAQLNSIDQRWYEEVASPRFRAEYERRQPEIAFEKPNILTNRLVLLQGGALLLLFVCALNVANLLASRTSQRCHELSVRHSFGANRALLSRLMLCESGALALSGAAIGSGMALLGLEVVNDYLSVLMPEQARVTLSVPVLVLALSVSTGFAVFMGLLPLLLLWKTRLIQTVDSSVRVSSASGLMRRVNSGLVVSQLAITFALLIGAGLLFRSFANVLSIEPGFEPSIIVAGGVNVAQATRDHQEQIELRKRVLAVVHEIPGVENVSHRAYSYILIEKNDGWAGGPFTMRGPNGIETHWGITQLTVGQDFFDTLGMPLLEGRVFRSDEPVGADARESLVVDELFVQTYLSGKDPVGVEMVTSRNPPGTGMFWGRIVGVVKRANFNGFEESDQLPFIYRCRDSKRIWGFTLLLRTKRPFENIVSDIRTKLREVHPNLHFYEPHSLATKVEDLYVERKGITLLMGIFAAVALLLSSIGIYGVLSYDVQQRRREIGIRSAIGASKENVLKLIVQEGMMKASFGLFLGLIGSIYLTRFLDNLLFGVTTFDMRTYFVALAGLLLLALAASFVPARQAASVSPLRAISAD